MLDPRKLTYALDGRDYVVRRVGNVTPAYELWRGDDKLAALTPHWPPDRYTLTVAEREWIVQREGFGAQRYGLFAGEERVGEVKSARRWFRADLVADLPADVAREIHVFLIWFALWQFNDPGT